ncbi:MAG: YHYH protein [Poseidonia sp.]
MTTTARPQIAAIVLIGLLVGSLGIITLNTDEKEVDEPVDDVNDEVHDHSSHDHGAPIVVALLQENDDGNWSILGGVAHAYPDLVQVTVTATTATGTETVAVLESADIDEAGAWSVELSSNLSDGNAWDSLHITATDVGANTTSEPLVLTRTTSDNNEEETPESTPRSEQCLDSHANLAMHTHPFMELVVNGTAISIPSNLGIDTSACPNAMHLLHTHDTSGKLHVEGYDAFTPTADLFFAVWNLSYPDSTTLDPLFLDVQNVSITVDGATYTGPWSALDLLDGETTRIVHDATRPDTDGDGVPDDLDACEGHDDNVDEDEDGIPDGCDDEIRKQYDASDLAEFWMDVFLCQHGSGTGIDDLNTTENDGHICEVTVTVVGDNVSLSMNGLPNHDLESGPGCCAAAQDYTILVPRSPVNDTMGGHDATNCPEANGAFACAPDRGEVAFALNGVPIYGPEDGPGGDAVASHHGVYEEDRQEIWLGLCHAHSGPGGAYHYHADGNCMHWHPEEGETWLDYEWPGNTTTNTSSEVIGIAFDGYPIYGAYGDAGNGTIEEMTSSYRLKAGETGYNGIDDYEYVEGLGHLDVCNGHFGPTPDFPNGIYHYHSTMVNGEGDMGFPYFLICYRGVVDEALLGGGGGNGDDACAGHGETWGPGIGPPPEGCDPGPPPGGQSTEPVLVPTLRIDMSIVLIVAVLVGAAWRLRR